jgi:hypothetical protein
MPFKALGLSPNILRGVQAMGYTDPTPIQLRAIPAVLAGKDLIGSAQTGTGKTAAFALPILTKLAAHSPRGARVLILEPTRNSPPRSKPPSATSPASPTSARSSSTAAWATATSAANCARVSTSSPPRRAASSIS